MMKKRYLFPLGLFLALASTLAVGLQRGNEAKPLPSPLVGKPVPVFELSRLDDAQQQVTPQDLKGKVWLLNAWASWCTSCRVEHPALLALAQRKEVTLVGFNYLDQREAGQKWLSKHGNPYELVLFDGNGRVGIDLGIVGVPETFLIDKQGTIRYKHTGALTNEVIQGKLLPLIRELQRG